MAVISTSPIVLIRALCGIWFLPHIVAKLQDIGFAAQNFGKAGFKPERLFVFIAVVIETLAAIGLVLGVYPRLAAILAATILLGASYAAVKIGGFNWAWHRFGMEYLIFWTLICLISAWSS